MCAGVHAGKMKRQPKKRKELDVYYSLFSFRFIRFEFSFSSLAVPIFLLCEAKLSKTIENNWQQQQQQ